MGRAKAGVEGTGRARGSRKARGAGGGVGGASGPAGPGAQKLPVKYNDFNKGPAGPHENVLRHGAHRGCYRPPSCGRWANDLGRLAPLRWRGLGAAPQL